MAKKNQIRNKIVFLLLSTIVVAIAIISVFLNYYMQKQLTDDFIVSTSDEVIQVDNAINVFFQGMKENCDFLAEDVLVKQIDGAATSYMDKTGELTKMTTSQNGGLEQQIYEYFLEYAETHPDASYVYAASKSGGYIQWPEEQLADNYDPRERPFYLNGMAGNDKVSISKPYYWAAGDMTGISLNRTITDQAGQLAGVMGIDVSLNTLTNMVKNIKVGENGYVILTEADGTILAHPKNKEMNFKNFTDLKIAGLSDITQAKDSVYDVEVGGKKSLANVYTSPNLGWKYIAVVDEAELMGHARMIKWISLIVAFVVILGGSVAAIIFSNRLAQPLTALADQMTLTGSGDLTTDISAHYLNRNDEIGTLASAYQQMVSGLRNLVLSIQENSENLAAAAQEMSASTQQISSGSQEQAHQVQVIAHAMEGVAGEDEQLSHEARDAANAAKEASNTADKGSVEINNVVSGMRDINENMHKLDLNSQKIGEIISVIDDIADQTNLLALNAAIEAARAGEHGRGFAVVADEVRKLAERSGKATKEISQLIATIQADMGKAVVASDKGGQMTEAAGQSFAKITHLVNNSAALIEKISEAVAQQASSEGDLLSVTANIAAVTEETAAGIEEIAASAEEMAAMSERLQNLTKGFKIS